MNPKPAIEHLYRVATRDERTASKRCREEENYDAWELKFGTDPVRREEDDCQQWNGNAEEHDKVHRAQTPRSPLQRADVMVHDDIQLRGSPTPGQEHPILNPEALPGFGVAG